MLRFLPLVAKAGLRLEVPALECEFRSSCRHDANFGSLLTFLTRFRSPSRFQSSQPGRRQT